MVFLLASFFVILKGYLLHLVQRPKLSMRQGGYIQPQMFYNCFLQANGTWQVASFNDEGSAWYLEKGYKNGVKKLLSQLPVEYRTNYREVMDDGHFAVSTSDVYYVPARYIDDFSALARLAGKVKLHRDLALPLLFMAMDNPHNFDGYAFSKTRILSDSGVKEDPALIYTPNWHVIYPWVASSEPELYRIIKAMSAGDPTLSEILE